jgi:hypothetical protein
MRNGGAAWHEHIHTIINDETPDQRRPPWVAAALDSSDGTHAWLT